MNEEARQKMIMYVMALLNAVNQISNEEFCQGPTLLFVTFNDHYKTVGWEPEAVVERLGNRPPLSCLGWRHFENEDWLILTGTEKNPFPVAWTILKNGIIKRVRLNTPEVLQALRWGLAACLMILGPKFDRLWDGG